MDQRMFYRRFRLTAVLALSMGMVVQVAYGGEHLSGKVVGVTDGDTVTVLDADNRQHKVRIAGIDAPEKRQPFGQRSKEHLSALVFGRAVEIVGTKSDRYGRTVAKIMVAQPSCPAGTCAKNVDAGLQQVRDGLAWWYRKYSREQSADDRARYEAGETEARQRHLGLWEAPNPTPPWEWRHRSPNDRASRDGSY